MRGSVFPGNFWHLSSLFFSSLHDHLQPSHRECCRNVTFAVIVVVHAAAAAALEPPLAHSHSFTAPPPSLFDTYLIGHSAAASRRRRRSSVNSITARAIPPPARAHSPIYSSSVPNFRALPFRFVTTLERQLFVAPQRGGATPPARAPALKPPRE